MSTYLLPFGMLELARQQCPGEDVGLVELLPAGSCQQIVRPLSVTLRGRYNLRLTKCKSNLPMPSNGSLAKDRRATYYERTST